MLRHMDAPRVFGRMSFVNCHFVNCALIQDEDASYPIKVEDVSASGGSLTNCIATGVSFRNVELSDCQAVGDSMTPAGCVFREVRLRGVMGSWIFNDMDPSLPDLATGEFLEAEREFYQSVDFALDISEGIFEAADMYHLPGDLVVRDPETQVLIRKDRLAAADLSQLPKSTVRMLRRVHENPYGSTAVVAGRAQKNFDEALAELRLLVELGIAQR